MIKCVPRLSLWLCICWTIPTQARPFTEIYSACNEKLSKLFNPYSQQIENVREWESLHKDERNRLEEKIQFHRKFSGYAKTHDETNRSNMINRLNHLLTTGQIQEAVKDLSKLFRDVELAYFDVVYILNRADQGTLTPLERQQLVSAYKSLGLHFSDYRAARSLLEQASKTNKDAYSEEYQMAADKVLEQIGVNKQLRAAYPNTLGEAKRPRLEDIEEVAQHPPAILFGVRQELQQRRKTTLGSIFHHMTEFSGTKGAVSLIRQSVPTRLKEFFVDLFKVYNNRKLISRYHSKILDLKLMKIPTAAKVKELREMAATDDRDLLLTTFARLISEERFWSAMREQARQITSQETDELLKAKYDEFYKRMLAAQDDAVKLGPLSGHYPPSDALFTARWLQVAIALGAYYWLGPIGETDEAVWQYIDQMAQRAVEAGVSATNWSTSAVQKLF